MQSGTLVHSYSIYSVCATCTIMYSYSWLRTVDGWSRVTGHAAPPRTLSRILFLSREQQNPAKCDYTKLGRLVLSEFTTQHSKAAVHTGVRYLASSSVHVLCTSLKRLRRDCKYLDSTRTPGLVQEPRVDVERLVAAFFRHRLRHQSGKRAAAPVGAPVSHEREPEPGQSTDVVDHLDEMNSVEPSRPLERRVYLEQQLPDVVGLFRFYLDEVAQERPLGCLGVDLQYVQHSLKHSPLPLFILLILTLGGIPYPSLSVPSLLPSLPPVYLTRRPLPSLLL